MGNIRFWPGARSPIVFLPAQPPEFFLHHPLGFLHVGLLPLRPVVDGTDWLDCRRQQLLAEGLRTEHSVAVNAFIVGSRLLRPPPFQQQVKPGPSGYLTGQQYSLRKEYAAKAAARLRKAKLTVQAAQPRMVKEPSQQTVPPPARVKQSTSGPHRGPSVATSELHCQNTGQMGQSQGSRKQVERSMEK